MPQQPAPSAVGERITHHTRLVSEPAAMRTRPYLSQQATPQIERRRGCSGRRRGSGGGRSRRGLCDAALAQAGAAVPPAHRVFAAGAAAARALRRRRRLRRARARDVAARRAGRVKSVTMSEGKEPPPIVICGHVDSGKSTTTGRLLFEMGGIPEREMEKLKAEADRLGKSSFAFAFYMDRQKEERERGVTISCTTKEFFTDKYHYTIVDAPGHKDYIKNMITGSATADVGMLLVPAEKGGFEAAIAKAIDDGIVAGIALDVYETEPPTEDFVLRESPNAVLTPHLGASTTEAQENVGIEIARTVAAHLKEGTVVNAVNMPNIDEKTVAAIGRYLDFAEKLGVLVSQIAPGRPNTLRVDYSGKVSDVDTTLITRSALKGYLQSSCEPGAVNTINAPGFAETQGIRVTESHSPNPTEFTDLIEVAVKTDNGEARVFGTFFGSSPRIVKIGEHRVEAAPSGTLLVLTNEDTPGRIGQVGCLLGEHKVNIGSMSLSRNTVGELAMTVFNLDSTPCDDVLRKLEDVPGVTEARVVQL